jgi:hypothetical protein
MHAWRTNGCTCMWRRHSRAGQPQLQPTTGWSSSNSRMQPSWVRSAACTHTPRANHATTAARLSTMQGRCARCDADMQVRPPCACTRARAGHSTNRQRAGTHTHTHTNHAASAHAATSRQHNQCASQPGGCRDRRVGAESQRQACSLSPLPSWKSSKPSVTAQQPVLLNLRRHTRPVAQKCLIACARITHTHARLVLPVAGQGGTRARTHTHTSTRWPSRRTHHTVAQLAACAAAPPHRPLVAAALGVWGQQPQASTQRVLRCAAPAREALPLWHTLTACRQSAVTGDQQSQSAAATHGLGAMHAGSPGVPARARPAASPAAAAHSVPTQQQTGSVVSGEASQQSVDAAPGSGVWHLRAHHAKHQTRQPDATATPSTHDTTSDCA